MSHRTSEDVIRTSTDAQCGQCGSARVSESKELDKFTYGNGADAQELSVQVPVYTCRDCGFRFTNEQGESLRHAAVCAHLGVLSPAQIRETRMRAGLSRERFAELTGLGVASLARWETAELIQSVSHDKYLRLLRYPENLERLRVEAALDSQTTSPAFVRADDQRAKHAFKTLAGKSRLAHCMSAALRFELRAPAITQSA
jgi:putative zinc finger/helix-turn-helix YgiT family protein